MRKLKFKNYQTNCNVWEDIEDGEIISIDFDGLSQEFDTQEELEEYIKEKIEEKFNKNDVEDLDDLVMSIAICYQWTIK